MVEIEFQSGTLALKAPRELGEALPCVWDPRTSCYRAEARAYAELVRALVRAKVPYEDRARRYEELAAHALVQRTPRPYQAEALVAWEKQRSQGVVVLPTGAGKSQLGVMAIEKKQRSTLVVAPTLDLVRQWYQILKATFAVPVGIIGGGEHDVQPLTVTTYDSAHLHMQNLGARFGLIIFDECHHLPGETYALAARQCLAPFRLGLTATPERADGREDGLATLIGLLAFRREITEMSGAYLAEYETERIAVELSPDERELYEAERAVYLGFVRAQGIRMGSPEGWRDFIMRSARSAAGRRAMQGYRRQRELAFAAPAKLEYVALLLHVHRGDRAIVFTEDNATAYRISEQLLIPAITHQTKISERADILAKLHDGAYNAVVTSKVLNEGVDVPSANVAIVVSGSGSVREHVQRLGRILRQQEGKHALLYELVTAQTGEAYTSERRREHSAYR
ncbi:MAG TPA: DEAD/DEAH box helicase family protein [Polyangiales bacterium]|nr:DEAD/DEAH box helicase family protein [Polyangiales bacterium]